MDEAFKSPIGTFLIQHRNDSKGSSGTFFLYEYEQGSRDRYLIRFNSDGTRDESFPPFNPWADGSSVVAFWPDGRILLMNSARMLRLRNKDGTVEWEKQLGGNFPPKFSHPIVHGNERVYILQQVEHPEEAQEIRWISSDGTNNFDSPIQLENVGEASYLTMVTDNVIVIGGTKRSWDNFEIWAEISNYPNRIVKFDSKGKVAAGFPHTFPFGFSLDKLEFLSDGTALLIGYYDAYTINPNGTINRTVFQGAFDNVQGMIGIDGDRILKKSDNYPQTINRFSFQAVPIIQQQPTKTFGTIGTGLEFNTSVFGDHHVQYQWFRNGEEIEGATNDTLLLSDLEVRDEDFYSVQITLGNVTVQSQPAKLTVVELEGFPTKGAPIRIETIEGGSIVRWKTDSAYSYHIETSNELSRWVRIDRPVLDDEGEASVFFNSSETDPHLFVRVISEIKSD